MSSNLHARQTPNRVPVLLGAGLAALAAALGLWWWVRSPVKQVASNAQEVPDKGEENQLSVASASPISTVTERPVDALPRPTQNLRSSQGPAPTALPPSKQLLREGHAELHQNPRRAEELARLHQERFPNSPEAEECDALLASALWNQGRIREAGDWAGTYLLRYPNGRHAASMRAMTRRRE